MTPLGLYVSIPFCRAKCSFCNFASDAFAPGRLPAYIEALCLEIEHCREAAKRCGAILPDAVDTIYFGGGTPSLLAPAEVDGIFDRLHAQFTIEPEAEVTVECAPGQLTAETLAAFQRHGVNRLSFGVQSFVDRESAATGRSHTAASCCAEIDRVYSAGIRNVSLDLIAGLPHQTERSWRQSLDLALQSGVSHLSIYLFEVDEESRLGREVLAEGQRYGAPTVPSDDETARLYEIACEQLNDAGVYQYEISNFARHGSASRHNLKYWRREPYLGFGLDAHSMLQADSDGALRFANGDDLDQYLAYPDRSGIEHTGNISSFPLLVAAAERPQPVLLTRAEILEETFFLGLRVNEGLSLAALTERFSLGELQPFESVLRDAEIDGLLSREHDRLRLTARGRLLSNELFSRLLLDEVA